MDQKCAVCRINFTQSNLAWMMSCCDHNICNQCLKHIKSLKNKQINCKQCKTKYDVDQQTLQQFPKNINIVKMLKQSKNTSNILSQSQNKNSIQNNSKQNSLLMAESVQRSMQRGEDMCKKHSKPLEIICTVDRQFICSSCALFGEHRNHNINNNSFRTKDQFQQQLFNLKHVYKQIQFKKQILQESIRGKKYRAGVISKISQKKDRLVKQIKQKFEKIILFVKDAENKMFQELIKCFRTVDVDISKVTKEEQSVQKHYNRWKKQISDYIKTIDESYDFKSKIHVFYRSNKPNIKQGQVYIRQLEQSCSDIKAGVQQKISSIKLQFSPAIQGVIYNYGQVQYNSNQIKVKSIKQIKPFACQVDDNKLNRKQMKIQFVKSDDLQQQLRFDRNLFKKDQVYRKQEGLKTTRTNVLHKVKSNPKLPKAVLQRHQEQKKPHTPPKLQNINKNNEQKHTQNLYFAERMLNQFLKSTDTLDITGCELSDQQIIHIVSTASEQKLIKCLKLGKNKLTNHGLSQLVQFMPSVTNINLSFNSLSDQSVDVFIDKRQQMPCLRIINLSHNKLNERKVKTKVQQLRKFGIITTL